MRKLAAISVTILVLAAFTNSALACTTFCLRSKGENLFGKNYDWDIGDGIVFVNRRGVHKISSAENNPAKWVSKYGSVTFNQYGWEAPSGGMNEAGLVIELMWLDESKYPAVDARASVDVLEWIQYNLDTAATTGELIRNLDNIRIESEIPLHYLVNDKAGNAATVEFLGGKLVAHTGDNLPIATLANDPYARSLEYAAAKDASLTRSASSLDRFTRASARTKAFAEKQLTEKEAIDYAFETLTSAAQNGTQWSIVYDQRRHKIHFRTKQNSQIRSIDARAFDYSCTSSVMMLDANTRDAGDVTRLFMPYTRAANRDLIERSFNGTDFLRGYPAGKRDEYADFPLRFTCAGVAPEKSAPKAANTASVSILDIVFPALLIYKQMMS